MPYFDGEFYKHRDDYLRLATQLNRVLAYMCDGRWHTVAEIADFLREPEASIQAQLRNLRKQSNGGYDVKIKYEGRLGSYRIPKVDGKLKQLDFKKISNAEQALMKLSKADLVTKVLRLKKKIKRLQQ